MRLLSLLHARHSLGLLGTLLLVTLLASAACTRGRGGRGRGGGSDGGSDGGMTSDGAIGMDGSAGCSPELMELGSSLGPEVAVGSTAGGVDAYAGACGGSGGLDVSYRWAAPAAGTYAFDTSGSDFDTVLRVFSADCGVELGCDDDGGTSGASRLLQAASAGETFVIVVDGFGTASGAYLLSIQAEGAATESNCSNGLDDDGDGWIDCDDTDCSASCPGSEICDNGIDDDGNGAADCADSACLGTSFCVETSCTNGLDDDGDGWIDCDDADCDADAACAAPGCVASDLSSTASGLVASGSNGSGTTTETGTCGGSGREVLFRYVAPRTGIYVFDTIDSTYDTVLYLRQTSCTGAELACDDDGGTGTTSRISVSLAAGATVYIFLDAYGATTTGTYSLNLTPAP